LDGKTLQAFGKSIGDCAMRATLLLLIILLGTASAQAVPRFFVEANAHPFDPSRAYLIKGGAMTAKRQLFIGYFNTTYDPDIDESGVYWEGTEQFLAGVHWFTTGNPRAVVVPSLGGGLTLGKQKNKYWLINIHQHPEFGFHQGEIDRSLAYGVFLDAELKFRIKPINLMLSTGFHFNISATSYETRDGDDVGRTQTINGYNLLLVGASYQF
jgi:hypothetical protein